MKEGWKKNTIGEIAFFQSGSRPKGGVGMIKEGVLSLGGEHIGTDGYVSITTPKYCSLDYYTNNPKGHIEGNDILLCKDGALTGKVAIVRKELKGVKAMINEHVFIIRSKLLLQKYLYYFLFSPNGQIQLKSRISGAAQGGLNGANLKTVSIPYPIKIEAQQQIVEELDLLSGIIKKKKEQLKEIDNLAKSIFHDIFGDTATNERGWEVKNLGELCSVITKGTTPTTLGFPFVDEGINFVKVESFIDGRIDKSRLSHITHECNLSLKRSKLETNDLLVCIAGATIGKMAIVDETILPANTNQACAILRLKDKSMIRYIQSYLELKFEFDVMQMGKGVAQPNLSLGQLRNLPIPIPSIEQRNFFSLGLESMEQQKALIKQSINEVETLFNSRMDYYFN